MFATTKVYIDLSASHLLTKDFPESFEKNRSEPGLRPSPPNAVEYQMQQLLTPPNAFNMEPEKKTFSTWKLGDPPGWIYHVENSRKCYILVSCCGF